MAELKRCKLSKALLTAYEHEFLRDVSVKLSLRLEGGDFYSATLRDILERHHGVKVGAYSYGEGLIPGVFPRGTRVGRYVSMAPGIRIFVRNHPLERLSMHPFFYNSNLGWLSEDSISSGTIEIGHDAWIGERAIITPGCKYIGIGAVVGAGAVITKDVPDFAVMVGNPARLLRYRFDSETIRIILAARWWERPIEECARFMAEMIKALEGPPFLHPLLSAAKQANPKQVEFSESKNFS
jgi:virginiamycin A acetyltransferase